MASNVSDVFRLEPKVTRFLPAPIAGLLTRPLERLLSVRRAARAYAKLGTRGDAAAFAARSLAALGVRFRLRGLPDAIPQHGPVIVIANHPYGGIEGLYLYAELAARRGDVRVLGHHLLSQLPDFAPVVFGVDALAGRSAAARNAGALRRALRWLKGGGALLVFPSPEVSVFDPVTRTALDRPWHPSIARLVDLARAPVVPVFVDGSNSALFHAVGLVHPRARQALLSRELFNKRRHVMTVTVGPCLPAAQLAAIDGDGALTEQLRLRLYALACWRDARAAEPAPPPAAAEPGAAERIACELAALRPGARLAQSGDFEVWAAPPGAAPALLAELARLRAVTAGSASAAPDAFDRDGTQLVVFNARTREVAAACRVAGVRQSLRRRGRGGLLSAAAFELGRPLRRSLSGALELGRIVVHPAYREHLAPLPLLWKGVAGYLARSPEYRVLLLTAHLDERYSPAAQALVTGYLTGRHGSRRGRRLVRARGRAQGTATALRLLRREGATIGALEALEALLRSIEADGRGLPPLLRQALQLGAVVLGCNGGREAAGSTDVLLLVELDALEPERLARFLGRDAAGRFAGAARGGHLRATTLRLIATP